MNRLAAIVPNVTGVSPGQRTRIEFWANRLEPYGWSVDLYPFEDTRLREVLHQPGQAARKAVRLASCYGRQLGRLVRLPDYDAILVYREAALIGPEFLERLAGSKRTPLVYDLDDPIFLRYRSPTNGWLSLLKFPGKVQRICRSADHVMTINRQIGEYASRYNPSVTVIPMFLDTDHYRPLAEPPHGPPRLGWIGSQSTMVNLQTIVPALKQLQAEHDAPLRVIGAGQPELIGVNVEARRWSAEDEVINLQGCHIGVVPLTDMHWNPWKFFYKTIQYMAVGLPVVARRMGSNVDVIDDGIDGFLVETQEEWLDRLRLLVGDSGLRKRMGEAGRRKVVEHYSAEAQMPRVAQVLDLVLAEGRGNRSRGLRGLPGGPGASSNRAGADRPPPAA